MGNKILACLQEAISEFREDPKNKMHDWWVSWIKLWIIRSLEYAFVFLVVIFICYLIFDWANLFYPPYEETAREAIEKTARGMFANNTRSMLPSLVESEAAIVAIVVSLTLIAVELTASAYSPRVINISLKNPDMWILLFVYGISIFFGLIILKMEPFESDIFFEDVSVAFWLGVFSYVALGPYIWHISNLLKPENIIKRLSEGIARTKILKYIKYLERTSKQSTEDSAKETAMTYGDTEGHKNVNSNKKKNKEVETTNTGDPIQPILDIIYKSINNYDLETVRKGLEEIINLASRVFIWNSVPGNNNGGLQINSEEKDKSISKYFCDQLKRIARLAASKDDKGSTIEVIKNLETFGKYTADKELNVATVQVAVALEVVGKIAVENGKTFEDAVSEVAKSLEEVGKNASDKGKELEDAVRQTAKSLEEVGDGAVENNLKIASQEAAKSLGTVGGATVKNNLKIASQEAAKSLGVVGKKAAEKGKKFEEVISKAVTCLGYVEREVIKKDFLFNWNNLLNRDIKDFAEFLNNDLHISLAKNPSIQHADDNKIIIIQGEKEIRLERKDKEKMVTLKTCYGNSYKYILKEENGNLNVYKSLVEFEETIEEVVKSLGAIGEEAAKGGLKEAVDYVVDGLTFVGLDVVKKELGKATWAVAVYLGNVGEQAAKGGLEIATMGVASSLITVGEKSVKKRLEEEVVQEFALSLGTVGEVAAKNNLKIASQEAVESLGVLGEEAAKERLENATKNVASSLITVGTITEGKEVLEDVAEKAASSLATLGYKNIVETVIDEYNSNKLKREELGESNFRNFIERYKQKLREIGKDAE